MFITHVHPYGEVQFSPLGFVPRGSDPRPQRILTSPPAVRAAPASVRPAAARLWEKYLQVQVTGSGLFRRRRPP